MQFDLNIVIFLEFLMIDKIIKRLDKESLEELVKVLYQTINTVDGLWFLFVEDAHGLEESTRIDGEVWKIMGKVEARRIKQAIDLEGVEPIKALEKMIPFISWLTPDEYEIKSEEDVLNLKVLRCKPQEERLKGEKKVFQCKEVAEDYFYAFIKEIDSNLKFECLACPPDSKPKDYWCEWVFKI